MPLYFVNTRTGSGEVIADPEGEEYENLEECRQETLEAAADLLANSRGLDWRDCAFEVTDEAGRRLFVIPFSEAAQPKKV